MFGLNALLGRLQVIGIIPVRAARVVTRLLKLQQLSANLCTRDRRIGLLRECGCWDTQDRRRDGGAYKGFHDVLPLRSLSDFHLDNVVGRWPAQSRSKINIADTGPAGATWITNGVHCRMHTGDA